MSMLLKITAILTLLKTNATFQLRSSLSLSRSVCQEQFSGIGQKRLLTVLKVLDLILRYNFFQPVLSISFFYHLKGTEAQELGEAIYDLQEMSSEDEEVLELVSALASKVQSCSEDFQAFDVSTAIYGLGRMSSDCLEVRELILALVPKVQGCREDFLAREVGAALCGLSEMNSDSSEVRELLSALVPKVLGCKEQLDSSKLDRALQGLQGMSSDIPEVRDLLFALRSKVDLEVDSKPFLYILDTVTFLDCTRFSISLIHCIITTILLIYVRMTLYQRCFYFIS
jgi:hypothetical protein